MSESTPVGTQMPPEMPAQQQIEPAGNVTTKIAFHKAIINRLTPSEETRRELRAGLRSMLKTAAMIISYALVFLAGAVVMDQTTKYTVKHMTTGERMAMFLPEVNTGYKFTIAPPVMSLIGATNVEATRWHRATTSGIPLVKAEGDILSGKLTISAKYPNGEVYTPVGNTWKLKPTP